MDQSGLDFSNMNFYGFDSFSGFGDLDDSEKHSFYTDINFQTDFDKVYKKIKKIIKPSRFNLIDGFFEETLVKKKKSGLINSPSTEYLTPSK